jgi:hypothetical protein
VSASYEAMLRRLSALAGVPADEQAAVVEQQAMMMNGMAVHFRLQDWSGFIKIHIEAGKPAPVRLAALCQSILEQQLELPAPFVMLTGLDAVTGSLVLLGCAPMPFEGREDQEFLAFLHACVDGASLLRAAVESGADGPAG